MNVSVYVHPRVHERHPELTDEDVMYAWEHTAVSGVRYHPDPPEHIAIGFDKSGRAIEMIAVRKKDMAGLFTTRLRHQHENLWQKSIAEGS